MLEIMSNLLICKLLRLVLLAILLALLATCSGDSPTAPSAAGSIELSSLVSPTPFKAEDKWHLVYEIVVRNQGQKQVEIDQVMVFDESQLLATYQGQNLEDLTSSNSRKINAGELTLIFLWITVAENLIPTELQNHVKFEGTTAPETYDVEVNTSTVAVLGPPLKGENWLALNISNFSGHRRTAIDFGGSLRIAQRFAIDCVQLGPDGQSFSGDSKVNSNYHAYGSEILAVSDGVVVATNDGIAENIPGERPSPVTFENIGGNWVLLKVGDNKFAFYAHLIPGSLRVQPGQTVRKGDVLGLLGNSGNSTEPHLHFHFGDVFDTQNNATLNTKGLPYVFESFEIQSGRPVLGERLQELPLDKAVIRFPVGL